MKVLDIALKDLTRSLRSTFIIGMTIVAPLLITALIYFAFGGLAAGGATNMPGMRVGVVNADTLPAGSPARTLLKEPLGSDIRAMFFDDSVKSWITATDYPDEAAARAAVAAGRIGVVVVIPASFTADYLAGKMDTQILMLQDPTLAVGPAVARNMITSLLDGVAGGGIAYKTVTTRQQANGVTPDPAQIPALIAKYRDWYVAFQRALFHTPERAAIMMTPPAAGDAASNATQSMTGMMMAGQIIFFAFFTGAYAMMSLLREDEEGTLARLFTTPTARTTILGGKFLAVFLTVVLQGIVLLAVGRLAFGVVWGAPLSVGLALLGQVFAATGLGILLISLIKTSKQAGPVLGGVLTMLAMLSGLFTTNIAMPAAFNRIGLVTPQGWVLRAWKASLAGQLPAALLVPFFVLLTMGAVMFAIGATIFRRRYA
jgi:ABC-2 type transport system permease protein